MVTICTASLTFNNSTFCPLTIFMCFVWISEQTAIISLYNINWLVCITETECVYCAVRAGSLNQTDSVSPFKGYHRSIHTHDKKPTNQNNTATGPPRGGSRTINWGALHVRSSIWCPRNTSKHTLICAQMKSTVFLPKADFQETHTTVQQRDDASPLVPNFTQIWQWLWPVWAEINLSP